ncbi:PREDICTED: 46 kDa FK506-binding nuclear protein [Ceratosolen solmsi marchali]|uniref:FK506-binding protein n=1 Tax=Ceratosolen solmsi marchali TaxID=326594 RepID=A0AAJ6YBI0_9HYME|nr:PREDICTED: 46 kDa FK506-binding nuclear protein [Ceratosolen solmsi marchali]
MFWGLIMQPNKRYMQTVERAFHLSMASLDATMSSDCLVQVMVCYDKRNYLLCTLQKNSIWQVPLDLNFQEGTKIGFTFNGDGHVHLTGYLITEEEELDEMDDFEEEDDEDIPKLVGGKKRKASNSPIEQNDVKQSKTSKVAEDEDDDDDDDESDSDNEDGVLEDDSDDDLDSEEEDMDEDESDEEDEDEDEIETPVKPSKKQKQKQNQQNQSNQQKLQNQQNQQRQNQQNNQQQNKKDKNKLTNGKDAKSEREQGKQKKNKEESKMEDKSEQQQQKRTIEGGVQVEDIKVGNGAPAKSGKFVSVYYIGRLKNGKKFDQTQQGEGFKFRLGKGEVIKGWDVGVTGMKVGGKRRLTIPPNMAYGAKGSPPVIPGNSTLNFEIELKAIH